MTIVTKTVKGYYKTLLVSRQLTKTRIAYSTEFLSSGSETVNQTALAIPKSQPSPLNSDPTLHS